MVLFAHRGGTITCRIPCRPPCRARRSLLGEPYTKQLDGKLRELRFYLGSRQTRVTYWIAPGRVIVLLTVFAKMRQNERHEVVRARRALARCMDEHGMTGDAR